MGTLKKMVVAAAGALFLSWTVANLHRLTSSPESTVQFVLGLFFALLVLFRQKAVSPDRPVQQGRWSLPLIGVSGGALAILGIVFSVHQLEWVGILVLLYTCLRWSLPSRFSRDLLLAVLLLYWIHPLPWQVFGRSQLALQKLSVEGSEWLLHAANVRVWADGYILRTGFRDFGVEESCSGLRTGITVFLCALGVGTVLRLRWYELLGLTVVGVLQVVGLNIVRIAFLVIWADRMPAEVGDRFLHDTLGVFLLASILLVQLEALGWRLYRGRRETAAGYVTRGEVEGPDKATILPMFWNRLIVWGQWLVLCLVVGLAGIFVAIKSRPYHREEMRKGVIDGLIQRDLALAQKAIERSLPFDSDSRMLHSRRLRVLVLQGKNEEALTEALALSAELTPFEIVLKSWALMGLDRIDEAAKLVDSLPASARDLPGVALVRAQYAVKKEEPDVAAKYVVLASRSPLTVERVRRLYPYLAAHEQWQAIADSDVGPSHNEIVSASLAIYARIKVRDFTGAARQLRVTMTRWPDDFRLLRSLLTLAVRSPGSQWESAFANSFRVNVTTLNAEQLSVYLDFCFQLDRPDLAWLAYLRLQELDATHPMLYMIPARFGEAWFSFRRHHLGVSAENQFMKIDLRVFRQHTRQLMPFASFWDGVPLGDELSGENMPALQQKYLRMCIEEIDRRRTGGSLTKRMELAYPMALSMAGRFEDAHSSLVAIEGKYPDLKEEVYLQHAIFYDREARWQESYEALLTYFDCAELPDLLSNLVMINALMNLNLGIYAMGVDEQAQQDFPGSAKINLAASAIWNVFGFHEQALFTLQQGKTESMTTSYPQLLYDAGRFAEAQRMSTAMGVRLAKESASDKQTFLPPPAEFVIARRWPPPLSPDEMDREAKLHEAQAISAKSPFIRDLEKVMAGWYRARGGAGTSDKARWIGAGRNRMEQASALHRLAILLARQGRYDEATDAVRAAIDLMPRSAILWRMYLGLTEGRRDVVERARMVCPNDSEVWLASLTSRLRDDGVGQWLVSEIAQAAAVDRYPVRTMIQAGDLLLRAGQLAPATEAAKDAISRCQGYLPAFVLGIKCAALNRDLKWALSCAIQAVENARDPGPFYRGIVEIKMAEQKMDADIVAALEYLTGKFPGELEWVEKLGYVYFQKGDVKRSLRVLWPVIDESASSMRVQSLLLAAEAARLEGKPQDAAGILETAYALNPDRLSVLNNLIYNLSQSAGTLGRAKELLPQLLEVGGESFAVLDTAAMVYLRSGDVRQASEYMNRALKLAPKDDYSFLEVRLNAAEVLVRMGRLEEAVRMLEEIRREAGDSPRIDAGARRLLDEVERQLRKK